MPRQGFGRVTARVTARVTVHFTVFRLSASGDLIAVCCHVFWGKSLFSIGDMTFVPCNVRKHRMNSPRDSSFLLVGSIPGEFHSADLRAFFSHFVEKGGFVCFHFRHRPEQLRGDEPTAGSGDESTQNNPSAAKSTCCVIAVAKGLEREFLELYHGKNWSRPDGELLRPRVKLTKLRITHSTSSEGD